MVTFWYLFWNDSKKSEYCEDFQSRLNSRSACCNLAQNVFPSGLRSKNAKIKIFRTITLLVLIAWVWNLVASPKGVVQTDGVENQDPRRMFEHMRDEVIGRCRKLYNEEFHISNSRFSRLWLWRVVFSGMWHRVVRYTRTYISELCNWYSANIIAPSVIQIKRRKWRWIGHTLRKPTGSLKKSAQDWNPQGARRRGRPKKTWKGTVEEESVEMRKTRS
jgi:hypothetical protein